jgi:prepilin-type N-terminal cleavage/methylation domain-containing protein
MEARKRERGFTLIEILIVIAMIAVLLAIAVPQLVKSKSAANEKSVVSTMRGLHGGQGLRLSERNEFGTLQELGAENFSEVGAAMSPATAQINLDVTFEKSGYSWVAKTPTNRQTYTIKAKPKEAKESTGDWLKNEVKAEVKPMFELKSKSEPMKATVRYLRRNWSFDASGRSDIDVSRIPDGTSDKKNNHTDYLPGAGKAGAGFHRPDATYVVEQEFEFDGSTLKAVGPAREEPVAPWNEIWNPRAENEVSR